MLQSIFQKYAKKKNGQNMIDKINDLLRRVEEFKPKAAAALEEFRINILGKKGALNALME